MHFLSCQIVLFLGFTCTASRLQRCNRSQHAFRHFAPHGLQQWYISFTRVCIIKLHILNTYVISFSHALLFLYFSETIAKEIMIPSVFTSYYAAQSLIESILPEQGWVDNCSVFYEVWGKLIYCPLSGPTELMWSLNRSFRFLSPTTSFHSRGLLEWSFLWCVSSW